MKKQLSNKFKNISLILTILVVFLHAYNLEESNLVKNANSFIQNFISYGICTIAVPMFFMISGYLFFYNFESSVKSWLNKYKKRFKSLVVPFVIWCVGWMLILYLIQLTSFGETFFSNMIVKKFTLKQLFEYTFKYPIPFQLWYISDLIKLVIISPIIYYVIKFTNKIYIPIIFTLLFLNTLEFPIVFYSIGCYLSINNISLKLKLKKKYLIFMIISFFSLITIMIFSIYDKSILLNLIRILGILIIWNSYDLFIENEDLIFKFEEYGIFVYFFHEPFQSFLYRITFKIVGRTTLKEFLLYFIIPIVTIIVSIIVAILIKKYFQKTYYLLTGGR